MTSKLSKNRLHNVGRDYMALDGVMRPRDQMSSGGDTYEARWGDVLTQAARLEA